MSTQATQHAVTFRATVLLGGRTATGIQMPHEVVAAFALDAVTTLREGRA